MLNCMESIFISAPTSPRLSNDDHARLREVSTGGGGAAQEQESGGDDSSGQHFVNCAVYRIMDHFPHLFGILSPLHFEHKMNVIRNSPFLLLICYVRTMLCMCFHYWIGQSLNGYIFKLKHLPIHNILMLQNSKIFYACFIFSHFFDVICELVECCGY